jgi:hypothetical protein
MPRAVDGATQRAIDTLQARIDNDPDIQAILQREAAQIRATHDRGGDARDYQKRVRDQITALAKQKGYIPRQGQYFLNPNDGQLEPHGGWAGLSNKTRAAIIIAAAATAGTAAALTGPAAGGVVAGGGSATLPAAGGGAAALGSVPTAGLFAPAGGLVGTTAATGLGTGTAVGTGVGTGTVLGGGGAVAAGKSIWDRLKGLVPDNVQDALSLAAGIGGPILAGQAQAAQSGRQAELAANLAEEDINQRRRTELWNQMLQREQEGRAGRPDAWRQLQQSQYVAGGGRPYTAPSWGTAFGFGPTAPSEATRTGARTLSDRSQQYLEKGPDLTPTVSGEDYRIDRSLLEPGTGETIAGLVGTGLTGYGTWQEQQRQRQQQQQQQQQWAEVMKQWGKPT